jgi:hypothetical protein
MRSFIQLTDTDNDILRSLPLGDLSTATTYSFRVWNNLPNFGGMGALQGLVLNILYPPKQGIQTLINSDIIKVRCTYSGERSESVSNSFQAFPLTGSGYDRLEPSCYNEYEVQIDFTDLTTAQKTSIDTVDMEFNIVATYDSAFAPLSLSQERMLISDTSIERLGAQVDILADTLIV